MKKNLRNLFIKSNLRLCTLLILSMSLSKGSYGQAAQNIVLSQVYGGGGNTGAPYTNDYIEIFNPTNIAVDMTGWSVQYATATGTTWSVTPLSGSMNGYSYLLIQESSGGVNGVALPTPDVTGTMILSATSGKIALCSDAIALSGACPTGGSIIDFVGYGLLANCSEGLYPAPAPSNTLAIFRRDNGCTDANDNSADFATAAPAPRNSATAPSICFVNVSEIASESSLIHAFPNPAHDAITLSGFQLFRETIAFEIINETGVVVLRSGNESRSLKSEITIDVKDFTKGIYLVRIIDGEKQYFKKIIVE